MDQGAIATFKALYRRITFSKAHETHETLSDGAVKKLAKRELEFISANYSSYCHILMMRKNLIILSVIIK